MGATIPSTRQEGWSYVAGLDLGLSRDASALVLLGKHVGYCETIRAPRRAGRPRVFDAMAELGILEESAPQDEELWHEGTGRLQVVKVLVWRPQQRKVELEEIERAILSLHKDYCLACVAFDPWQCEYLAQRLSKQGVPARPIVFSGANLQAMATSTLDAFREHNIDLPNDADLLADLRAMRVTEKSYGFRLESPRETADGEPGTRHGDAAQALSLALLGAVALRVATNQTIHRKLVFSP